MVKLCLASMITLVLCTSLLVTAGGAKESAVIESLHKSGVKIKRNEAGQVTQVSFRGVKDTDSSLALLKKLDHIETLDLLTSGVTDAGLAHVAELKQLQNLSLEVTPVTGIAQIKGLVNLRVLNLSDTQITDKALEYVQHLQRLEELYLYRINISDAGLVHLKALKHLEVFHFAETNLWRFSLYGTHVTNEGLKCIRQMKKLTMLDWFTCRI